MMKLDLERVRKAWIEATKKNKKERKRREESDFVQYAVLGRERHVCRFSRQSAHDISNLAKSGVAPKVAQTMARHSDINLTTNVYSHISHIEKDEQAARLASFRHRQKGSLSKTQNAASGERSSDFAAPGLHTGLHKLTTCVYISSHFRSPSPSGGQKTGARQKPGKPGFFSLFQHYSSYATSSGGGIRTPDTRIMIPLL